MTRVALRILVLTAVTLTLGACSERAVAPLVPAAPAAPAGPTSPLSLIGEVPTNQLIGETPTITYSAADGAFTARLAVNQGLLNASQSGEAAVAVRVSLRITDTDGDQIVVIGGCPLADVKPLADPRPDPFAEFALSIPWDGKDSNGNTMSGKVSVAYSIELVKTLPNLGDVIALGGGSRTGFFDIEL